MNLGFESWKDIIGVLVIPVSLALIALFWPELQLYYRRRAFRKLIFRELQEVGPYPDVAKQGMQWWEHLQKDFIHKRIFEDVSGNRDFILSLPAELVYLVSQLWDAMKVTMKINGFISWVCSAILSMTKTARLRRHIKSGAA